MRLRQIEVFHAVYSCGSITQAAKILNVSQPSVSKVLAHAEQQLGYVLFERLRGKLVPTPEANVLFAHAAEVAASLDRLRQVAGNLQGMEQGRIRLAAGNHYNPMGPCSSPYRLPEEVIGPDVPCEGLELRIDNYRWAEVPRIVNNNAKTYRILQGFRGSFGENWDWDSAILYNKAERDEVTRNRISNTLLAEALADTSPNAYNPWGAGEVDRTNIECTLVDVYRNNEAELALIDFKLSNPSLFRIRGGNEVGFLAGAEYRDESFKDDRDPRLLPGRSHVLVIRPVVRYPGSPRSPVFTDRRREASLVSRRAAVLGFPDGQRNS
jgi:hypothetical protein